MVMHAFLAIAIVAATARGDVRPVFAAAPGGIVTAALPDTVLQDPAVHKQITSGLTTVAVIIVTEKGTKSMGVARLEMRYDLWDEVWIVRKIEADGHVDRQRIASFDALLQWWHSPTRIFSSTGTRAVLNVELRLLPFSAAEEQDARDWISKSGGVASPAAEGNFVQTLIATTITARPITTYRWPVDILLK